MPRMVLSRRRVAILGSTGSVGRQAIEVALAHPDRFEVVALVANSNRDLLESQAASLGLARTGLGSAAAEELAASDGVDIVLNAIVGAAGLRASVAALRSGKTLALANKESLVAGGEVCRAAAGGSGAAIVPVDSEHAAIAQCLQGARMEDVHRIVLTASGGPFRRRPTLEGVTAAEALAHPTWSMGPKITIDCATLMNKGLEVIEAHHLFGLDFDRIGVVVHPQSIVHGIVEFRDGSSLLQAAPPDMRIPIQAALSAPERLGSDIPAVDLAGARSLEFEPVDHRRFRAVGLAYEAGRRGATYPAALNAANEVAVHAFLEGGLELADICGVIEATLEDHEPGDASELEAVLEADGWARRRAARVIGAGARTAGRV